MLNANQVGVHRIGKIIANTIHAAFVKNTLRNFVNARTNMKGGGKKGQTRIHTIAMTILLFREHFTFERRSYGEKEVLQLFHYLDDRCGADQLSGAYAAGIVSAVSIH